MPFYTWRVGANVYVCLLMHACECQPRPHRHALAISAHVSLYLCICVCARLWLISITKPAQLTCYHNWRTKLKILCRRQNKAETENCDHNCLLQDPPKILAAFPPISLMCTMTANQGFYRPSIAHWQVNANIVRASRINWY